VPIALGVDSRTAVRSCENESSAASSGAIRTTSAAGECWRPGKGFWLGDRVGSDADQALSGLEMATADCAPYLATVQVRRQLFVTWRSGVGKPSETSRVARGRRRVCGEWRNV
jgi:hypothetical protein